MYRHLFLSAVFSLVWLSDLQASPILSCKQGGVELFFQTETGLSDVKVTDPELVAKVLESQNGKACVENYYDRTRTVCVAKTLSPRVSVKGGELVIRGLSRWQYGAQIDFQAGQYSPSLSKAGDAWVLSLSNFTMVNSKQVAHWENARFLLDDCLATSSFPTVPVTVRVWADRYEGGRLISEPYAGMGVYAGPWQAGQLLGQTDEQGRLTTDWELGGHHVSFFKMTSSHSAVFTDRSLQVAADGTEALEVHVAPVTVRILSQHASAYGKALYVTGEGEYLGEWTQAWRMTPNQDGSWELAKNLPIGARFKIIEANWTDAESIIVDPAQVRWEQGEDRVIPAPVGFYESVVRTRPRF